MYQRKIAIEVKRSREFGSLPITSYTSLLTPQLHSTLTRTPPPTPTPKA